MATGNKNGSSNEHHHQAAELHKLAAHAHFNAAESHGKQDHLTGNERSRQALEYSKKAFQQSQPKNQPEVQQAPVAPIREEDVAALAHRRWRERGCPLGSPEEDWQQAEEELRSRSKSSVP